MDSFQELRYPFTSLAEFIGGGYWLQRAGWHLTLGLAVLVSLSVRVLVQPGPLLRKLIVLYFATALYNNPAYSLGGFRFGELCGVLSAGIVAGGLLAGRRISLDRVGAPLVVGALLIAAHAALASIVYPRVDPDLQTRVLRAMLVGRIFVLGLVVLGIEETFTTRESLDTLVRTAVAFGVAAAVIYLVQAGLFVTGTVPYGTYWDAGFTGIPSFGAVSIERGHFGKFFVLLFPLFAYALIRYRWRVAFALFVAVTLINFSASSFAFLAGYAVLSLVLMRRYLARPAGLAAVTVMGGAVVGSVFAFAAQYAGIVEKILDMGLRGGDEGGRGASVLGAYLSRYPLGIGYGGSTLRTVSGLPEINMGGFALLTQLSIVALPVLFGFGWMSYRVARQSAGLVEPLTRDVMVCGIAMALLIGLADILWFVPTLWAPLVVCNGLTYVAVREAAARRATPARA